MAQDTVDISFVHDDTPMRVGISGRFGWIAFNVNHKHSKRNNFKGFGFTLETIDHAIKHLGSVKKALAHKEATLAKAKRTKAKGSARASGAVSKSAARRKVEDRREERAGKARSKSEQRRLDIMRNAGK